MSTRTECPGSYGQVDRERDNVLRLQGAGAWAVGTCPVCECRVPVMRPIKRRPVPEFGRHYISVVLSEELANA